MDSSRLISFVKDTFRSRAKILATSEEIFHYLLHADPGVSRRGGIAEVCGWKSRRLMGKGTMISSMEHLEPRAYLSFQTAYNFIGMDQFGRDIRYGGGGTGAVVDIDVGFSPTQDVFGVDRDHNGLGDRIAYAWDFSSGGEGDANVLPPPEIDHGIETASIIANTAGSTKLILLKAMRDDGRGDDGELGPTGGRIFSNSAIRSALQWTWDNAARYNIVAVNMSLGSGNYTQVTNAPDVHSLLHNLRNNGVIVVAAVGNNFSTPPPSKSTAKEWGFNTLGIANYAADPDVLAVAADYDTSSPSRSKQGKLAELSQRQSDLVDIVAPGIDIDFPNTNLKYSANGTSLSTPFVAATVSLIQQLSVASIGRKLNFTEFRERLYRTGDPFNDVNVSPSDGLPHGGGQYKRLNIINFANDVWASSQSGVKATKGVYSDKVIVTWNRYSTAHHYLLIAEGSDGSFRQIEVRNVADTAPTPTGGSTATTFQDSAAHGLRAGVKYRYRIVAVTGGYKPGNPTGYAWTQLKALTGFDYGYRSASVSVAVR